MPWRLPTIITWFGDGEEHGMEASDDGSEWVSLRRGSHLRVDEIEERGGSAPKEAAPRVLVVVLVEDDHRVEEVDDGEAYERGRDQVALTKEGAAKTGDDGASPRG